MLSKHLVYVYTKVTIIFYYYCMTCPQSLSNFLWHFPIITVNYLSV